MLGDKLLAIWSQDLQFYLGRYYSIHLIWLLLVLTLFALAVSGGVIFRQKKVKKSTAEVNKKPAIEPVAPFANFDDIYEEDEIEPEEDEDFTVIPKDILVDEDDLASLQRKKGKERQEATGGEGAELTAKPAGKWFSWQILTPLLQIFTRHPKRYYLEDYDRDLTWQDQLSVLDPTFPENEVKQSKKKRKRIKQTPIQPSLYQALEQSPTKKPGEFELPYLGYLNNVPKRKASAQQTTASLERNAHKLEKVLEEFGVRGKIINARPGPVVTLYELEPAAGIKSSRVISLADDIARSMSAMSVRVAVVPGRNVIGIELPNKERQIVYLRTVLESKAYQRTKAQLALALGEDIAGEPVITDLAKMPHLLVAGTTGSGKSVGINTMILSLLYKMTPEQCRFIMVDPKMLELSVYQGIPHLLTPVVTDPKKAVVALKWAVREMEERYRKMAKLGVRNIDGYNKRIAQMAANGEEFSIMEANGVDPATGQVVYATKTIELTPLPYIVIIIDEMADLMMVAGKEIEAAVQRLAQMARAAGLHVIMATQRPSVDVITGTIKANFPTRISFSVTSKIDSRTILGEQGAEQLLGQGDMLFMMGGGRIQRVHGPFVSDREVEEVVKYLKNQATPEYEDNVMEEQDDELALPTSSSATTDKNDALYQEAVAIIRRDRKVSTSYIQRRLSIGYNKAATLIERMEEEGLISSANHVGKREILIPE